MYRKLLLFTLALLSLVTAVPSIAQDAACPTDSFVDVSQSVGAGDAYARPTIAVSCAEGYLIVESNNITPYEYWQVTPNALVEQQIVYHIPQTPTYSETTTPLPLLGSIGVAVNGLNLTGPNEAAMPVAEAYGDPIFNSILDYCMGHTAQEYHYHALIQACFRPDSGDGEANVILGYAFDGYPIYSAYGCLDAACSDVVMFESSYQRIGDPTTNAWDAYEYVAQDGAQYLDECNGRIEADGSYGYHVTNTFPYIIGCYHGVADGSFNTQVINSESIFSWADFVANGYSMGDQPMNGHQMHGTNPPPQDGNNPPPAGGNPPPQGGNNPPPGGNPPQGGGNNPPQGGGTMPPQVTPDHAGCSLEGWEVVCGN